MVKSDVHSSPLNFEKINFFRFYTESYRNIRGRKFTDELLGDELTSEKKGKKTSVVPIR